MRFFYIQPDALRKEPVALKGSELRHIKNVLRLKPGNRICLVDGQGFEYEAVIRRFLTDRVELEITDKRPGKKESPVSISVAQALLKEKKMDRLLRHLCELGVAHWIPFISERAVPVPGAKRLSARRERWKKILQESVKQCHRAKLPQISETKRFEDILNDEKSWDVKIILYENQEETLNSLMTSSMQASPQNILLILGPEGGFSNEEIEKARSAGCLIAGLGPRILRAETATIAACALAQYLFGDMG
ncbi:MAG: 16S rRNA (uracil(1498)-N(3))-methyltransferase [Desulfobacterales bacterium]|jgi:16S rRNA (uracil1498-N3)-methyltransferase